VTVTYDDYEPGAVARLDGAAGGVRIAGTVPAP